MREKETRYLKGVALRLSGDDKAPVLSGYIARFNQRSEDMGGFREVVAPGAFSETIERDDIRALWNHDDNMVLGRTSAGTLDLEEDQVGLSFKNRPPDTTWFRDRVVSLKRRDVTGSSFGFYTDVDAWSTEPDGTRLRTLKKITLVEVSPGVTFPAYPQSETIIRSMNLQIARRSMERWLGAGRPAGSRYSPDWCGRRLAVLRNKL